MGWVVLGIIEMLVDKLALWINVCVDDQTAESAIIASNAQQTLPCNIILKMASLISKLISRFLIMIKLPERSLNPLHPLI